MIGRVGDDAFGIQLLDGLRKNRVNVDHVRITRKTSSGVAMIFVDDAGENCIVVAAGANASLAPKDLDAAESLIAKADVVLLQLEIPLKTVRHAIHLCRRHKVKVILDPAPAPPNGLPRDLFRVDILTPNETESEQLLGRRFAPDRAASELLARGAKCVILKLGERGALLYEPPNFIEVKAHKVNAVDTTAAGDAFTGALAVALAEGSTIQQAVNFANAAGAACCQTLGAQPSLPTRRALNAISVQNARRPL
jgi:ribokinase